MKCKYCKREIPDNSLFCNWCGKKQLKVSGEISVPAPKRRKNGDWYNQMMVQGTRIYIVGHTEEE